MVPDGGTPSSGGGGNVPDGGGDVDECATNNGGCGKASAWKCTNVVGGPPKCTDVDECLLANGGCGNATFFKCSNNVGKDPTCADIDECATNNGGCGSATFFKCSNNLAAPPTCADIDECATNNGGCGSATFFDCTNKVGAAPTCADIDECATNNGGCGSAGFFKCTNVVGKAPVCADIDECATNNGGCGAVGHFTCTNVVGGPRVCGDFDECKANTDNCDPVATCNNVSGGFTCACPSNTVDVNGNGTSCQATAQCQNLNCDAKASCVITGGAPHCQCPSGYSDPNGNGTSCLDIDECKTNNGGCGSATFFKCTNQVGGPPTCADIDECATSNGNCGAAGRFTCTNVVGGPPTCKDVDECTLNTDNCDPAATCTNTPGNFTCKCPAGMLGDGVTCSCDLTGTFVLRAQLDVEWKEVRVLPLPFPPAIAAGSDTEFSYFIRKQTQTGSTLTVDTISCGGTAQDLCSPLLNKAFSQQIPNSIWEGPKMPIFHSTVTLGTTRLNDAFLSANEVALLGLSLTNPTGTWPATANDAAITWLDHDNDGPLGITSTVIHTGTSTKCGAPPPPYDYLPDPSGGAKTIGTVYTGSRSQATYKGTILSCNNIAGGVLGPATGNKPLIDGHVKGCLYSDGTPCSAATISSLDSQASSSPQRVVDAQFKMLRAAAGINCTQARATAFP